MAQKHHSFQPGLSQFRRFPELVVTVDVLFDALRGPALQQHFLSGMAGLGTAWHAPVFSQEFFLVTQPVPLLPTHYRFEVLPLLAP